MTRGASTTIEVRFSKQRRKNGWFLIEQWPDQKTHLEYGPMPEEHLEPLMNEITARHQEAAKASAEALRQNLAAIQQPGKASAFDPTKEKSWLQKRKR